MTVFTDARLTAMRPALGRYLATGLYALAGDRDSSCQSERTDELAALTVGFAQAFGPTVRVTAIQAGPFLTDISTAWTDEMRRSFEQDLALSRCGRPDEIVGAALFLASGGAVVRHGAVLRLDGGVP